MIDLEKKIIYFGYGDVSVGFCCNVMSIRGYRQQWEVGSRVDPDSEKIIVEPICFYFSSLKELKEFEDFVVDTDIKKESSFNWRGYEFNFSNRNPKSFGVIYDKINNIRKNIVSLMAG